jgi:hypothetical protein
MAFIGRPSEIGKLRTADIVRDGEFWFIDMRRDKQERKKAKGKKTRELKTENAYRRVPIPSLVVDLGLIDLKIALEARGETRLFPDWHVYRHPQSGREMWGHYQGITSASPGNMSRTRMDSIAISSPSPAAGTRWPGGTTP